MRRGEPACSPSPMACSPWQTPGRLGQTRRSAPTEKPAQDFFAGNKKSKARHFVLSMTGPPATQARKDPWDLTAWPHVAEAMPLLLVPPVPCNPADNRWQPAASPAQPCPVAGRLASQSQIELVLAQSVDACSVLPESGLIAGDGLTQFASRSRRVGSDRLHPGCSGGCHCCGNACSV